MSSVRMNAIHFCFPHLIQKFAISSDIYVSFLYGWISIGFHADTCVARLTSVAVATGKVASSDSWLTALSRHVLNYTSGINEYSSTR
jgi:hypothetical protein